MNELFGLTIQQIILIIIIFIIIYLYFLNRREYIESSYMYIPNCNMLDDKEMCDNTTGCYYDYGCRYDWINLQ